MTDETDAELRAAYAREVHPHVMSSDFRESLREARAIDAQQHYADQARIATLEARLARIVEILDKDILEGDDWERVIQIANGQETT